MSTPHRRIGPTAATAAGTGALLIAALVLTSVGSLMLGAVFDWPARLDDPASTALPEFAAHATAIRVGFYFQLLSSLALVPAAIGLSRLFPPSATNQALTTMGVAGALVQLLGWVRWPVTVPSLAHNYLAAAEGSPERAAIGASYDMLNVYAGGSLGEHLGFLLQGIWAIGLAILFIRHGIISRWSAIVSGVASVIWMPMWLSSQLFGTHISVDATIAVIAYTVWLLWLGVVGGILMARRNRLVVAD